MRPMRCDACHAPPVSTTGSTTGSATVLNLLSSFSFFSRVGTEYLFLGRTLLGGRGGAGARGMYSRFTGTGTGTGDGCGHTSYRGTPSRESQSLGSRRSGRGAECSIHTTCFTSQSGGRLVSLLWCCPTRSLMLAGPWPLAPLCCGAAPRTASCLLAPGPWPLSAAASRLRCM